MPNKLQIHVNQLLSNVSVQYKNQEYIADKVFPVVPVIKDSNTIRVYERNYKMQPTARAPGAVAREMSWNISSTSYILEQHALKDFIPVDHEENNDLGSLQVDSTEILTDAIMRRMEASAALLFTTTSWSLGVTLTAGLAFSTNTTTTDPVPVFDTGTSVIIQNTGMTPNFGILPRAGFVSVKNHVSVLDRVKYTNAEVGEVLVARLLGLNEMLVPTAIKDDSLEGVEGGDATFTAFWIHAFVGYKAPSPGLKQVSCGYNFMRSAPRVRTWFDQERNSNVVEVEVKYQSKVVASLGGYLISGI